MSQPCTLCGREWDGQDQRAWVKVQWTVVVQVLDGSYQVTEEVHHGVCPDCWTTRGRPAGVSAEHLWRLLRAARTRRPRR
jgi:hypothetical protein